MKSHGVPIIPWGRHRTIRSPPRPFTSNLTPLGGPRRWIVKRPFRPCWRQASLSAYGPVVSYPCFTLSQGIQQNARSTVARLSRLPMPPCSMLKFHLREEAALNQLGPPTDLRVRRAWPRIGHTITVYAPPSWVGIVKQKRGGSHPGDRALIGPRPVGRPPSSQSRHCHRTKTTPPCGVPTRKPAKSLDIVPY